MRAFRRLLEVLRRLRVILGTPGLMIGFFAFLSFAFGFYVLVSEYNRPRRTAHDALHLLLQGWARAPNYLGLTLFDYVDLWRHAPADQRPAHAAMLGAAFRGLGDELSRQNDRFPLFRIVAMEVRPQGGPALAHWGPSDPTGGASPARVDTISLSDPGPFLDGQPQKERLPDLVVFYQVAASVERAALGLESSYHRLLLAVLGLSGYSLLCLGYMILHAATP